ATATRASSRSSATSATRRSPRSTRGHRRSSAWSSRDSSSGRRRTHELARLLLGPDAARGARGEGLPRGPGRALPAPRRGVERLSLDRVRLARPCAGARGLAAGRQEDGRAPAAGEAGAGRPAAAAKAAPMTRREWLEKRYRTEKERDVRFSTVSDMEVEPLYTAEDLPPDAEARIGFPGEFPYTRGVYPSMYRGRLWTMRQFAGFATPEDTNERFHFLLKQGQTGLSTAFDM